MEETPNGIKTVGDVIDAQAVDGPLGAFLCALLAFAVIAASAKAWPWAFEVFDVEPGAAFVVAVALSALSGIAVVLVLLARRRIPSKREIERRVLQVIVSQGCMNVSSGTPFAQVKMRISVDFRRRTARIVSSNVYLREFDWVRPAVKKMLGVSFAEVSQGDELVLFFGQGGEDALAEAYRRAER